MAGARVRQVVGRVPFTVGLVGALLVAGVATGALWRPLEGTTAWDHVAYGVPALAEGRWWTPVTGFLVAATPQSYVPTLAGAVLLVAFAERRLGTARTALLTVGGHVVAVLGTTALLAALGRTSWTWAQTTARTLDVGPSGGVLAATAAAVLTLRAPWRGRALAVLLALVGVLAVVLGAFADVVHLVGAGVGLLAGTVWSGQLRDRAPAPDTPHATRSVAAGYFLVSAVVVVVTAVAAPQAGPLGSLGTGSAVSAAVAVTLDLAVAAGLRRGRRAWWRVAVTLTALGGLLAATLLVAFELVGEPDPAGAALVVSLALDVATLTLLLTRRADFLAARRAPVAGAGDLDADEARGILARTGSASRIAWMTTWPGLTRWRAPGVDGYVAYQRHAGVALVLGDPVAPAADRAGVVEAFARSAVDAGLVPAFFSATTQVADVARARGWLVVQVAEEALVDLPGLELRGKPWQNVRTALNQAAKTGLEHRLVTLRDAAPGLRAQVEVLSATWVAESDLPEMGFTLGGVREALDPAVRVGLAVDADERVHGVTSWLPVHGDGGAVVGWTLDVMRRAPDAARPTMELLIAQACLTFRDEGALVASLSGAPLAGELTSPGGPTPVDRALTLLAGRLEPVYGFSSLHAFKQKFHPRHEPLHLVVPDEAALPAVGLALVRAYVPDLGAGDVATVVRSVAR